MGFAGLRAVRSIKLDFLANRFLDISSSLFVALLLRSARISLRLFCLLLLSTVVNFCQDHFPLRLDRSRALHLVFGYNLYRQCCLLL